MVSEEEKLRFLLKDLGIVDNLYLIESGLQKFRDHFTALPNRYPGDGEYFDLFKFYILKGESIEQAHKSCMVALLRETSILRFYNSIGKHYTPFFR